MTELTYEKPAGVSSFPHDTIVKEKEHHSHIWTFTVFRGTTCVERRRVTKRRYPYTVANELKEKYGFPIRSHWNPMNHVIGNRFDYPLPARLSEAKTSAA